MGESGMKTYKKGGRNSPASIEIKPSVMTSGGWYEETVEEVNKLPITAVPKQSILKEDAAYFGIRSRIDPNDSTKLLASYFPYPNQEGEVVGYKKRDWTVPKEHPRHFTTVGVVGVKSMLLDKTNASKVVKCLYRLKEKVVL